jgi:homoserine O-succinyltransferase/O-acetyltransferase
MKNRLRIGLINNMSDGALEATERQFTSLLEVSSCDIDIELLLYSLPEIARSAYGTDRIHNLYRNFNSLSDDELDGLIVTGREPERQNLCDEAYWDSLVKVLVWAKHNTISAIWSCLAAHAAVQSEDGIGRQKRKTKACGVLECIRTFEHPLTAGLPERFNVPHSRWNGLSNEDLVSRKYQILSLADGAGVDMFVRQYTSLFVFFQGHPEYEKNTLLSEYLRDVRRFLKREIRTFPGIPERYFDLKTVTLLQDLRRRMERNPSTIWEADLGAILNESNISATWSSASARIYRNWLQYICAEKQRRQDNLKLHATVFNDAEGADSSDVLQR